MKKLVVAALLTAGIGMITSCNNGEYDVDPNTSGSPLNPLNPASGVTVYLGTMKANIFGTKTMFYPASYKVQEDGSFLLVGQRENDPLMKHRLRIGISDMKSLKEFNYVPYYYYIDTNYHRDDSFIVFGVTPEKGNFKVTLSGNEEGNFRGHFSGSLYRILPVKNLEDSVVFTDGEFYLPKVQESLIYH